MIKLEQKCGLINFILKILFRKKISRDYDLKQGIVFAINLADKLKIDFPGKHFKIIVSTDEGKDTYPEVCTIGFYTVRPNESWLLDNLEEYRMNGILVIEI